MDDDLQQTVDRLAAALGRSVYLDDPRYRTLATSRQLGTIDEARVQAVLDREPDARHLGYFRSQGLSRATAALRIPPHPETGLLARVVLPVLLDGRLLARLWLIDAEPALTDAEVATAEEHLDDIRSSLARRAAVSGERATLATQQLAALVTDGGRQRTAALGRLALHLGHDEADHLRAARVDVAPGDASRLHAHLVRQPEMYRSTSVPHDDHLVMLLDPRLQDTELLEPLLRRSATAAGARPVHAGVGTRLGESADLHASLSQATFAARVAQRQATHGGVRTWEHLGELRMFASFTWGAAGVRDIDPAADRLLTDGRGLGLTVLSYLERQGDVAGAARALGVHRTTLYHRLGLAGVVMGADLSSLDRLRLHAALRFAQLCCPDDLGGRPAGPRPI